MSTVEIDGVLYEKNEDREGVITFTPVEQKTHKLEFTERELNMIVNLIYVHLAVTFIKDFLIRLLYVTGFFIGAALLIEDEFGVSGQLLGLALCIAAVYAIEERVRNER